MADNKQIVALNLGSQRISAARFARAKGGALVLQDYAFSEMLGDPAADSTRISQMQVALAELTDKLRLKKLGVHYAMSGQSVFTRFVKLPPLGDENVDKLVSFEAQQNVPFPMNEVSWDYQLVGENEGGDSEIVLVAIKSDSLDEYNEAVEGSGLVTDLVDVAPMAIFNAFRYNYPDLNIPALLIDIGARSTNLIYFDGDKVFTRSIPVGGSLISSNIQKEFRWSFTDAEARKKADGFVALGGSYADHENPEIAGMSKVIRETLGRLHAEIGRTNNFFRSQQGGKAPKIAYLCGGSAGLPYIQEFFSEKLNIPVEYFDALRKVKLGSKVDAGAASADARSLGELVGLGLRGGGCPMEIDLVPDSVEARRDIASKKPFLILTALTLFSLLGAGIFFFKRATSFATARLASVKAEEAQFSGLDRKLKNFDKDQKVIAERAAPLEEAVADRTFWVRLLADLNNRFDNDLIWFTSIEPLSAGAAVTTPMTAGASGGGSQNNKNSDKAGAKGGEEGPPKVDSIRILGLYRENPAAKQVVWDLVEKLRESPYLDLSQMEKDRNLIVPHVGDPLASDPRWAYDFVLNLPLNRKLSLPK